MKRTQEVATVNTVLMRQEIKSPINSLQKFIRMASNPLLWASINLNFSSPYSEENVLYLGKRYRQK